MKKQRGLLKEAQRAGDMVRAEQAAEQAAAPVEAAAALLSRLPSAEELSLPRHSQPQGQQTQVPFVPLVTGAAAANEGFSCGLYSPGSKPLPPLKPPSSRPSGPPPSVPPSPPSPHRPPPVTPPAEGPAPGTPAAAKMSQVMPVNSASTDENAQIAELVRSETSRLESEAPPVVAPGFLTGKPRLRYAYDIFMAALPCIFFIVCCMGLGVIENVSYDCYNTDLFPTHADVIAASNCWTAIDSFYYSIITLSTIGYGDVTPHSVWGQVGQPPSRATASPALASPSQPWPALASHPVLRPASTYSAARPHSPARPHPLAPCCSCSPPSSSPSPSFR